MRRGTRRCVLTLCALSAWPAAGICQAEHVATLAESLSRTTIRAPSIAPDGRSVAYLRRETNWKENEFVAQLWLVNVATGKAVQLTRGKKSAGPAEWSPDGRWLAFVTEREANAIEAPVQKEGDTKDAGKTDADAPKPAVKQIWLIAPDGGSCLLAVKNGGGPFTAWGTLFERTSDRIRARFEPRFPQVNPHRLRHTFSMRTLEYLVTGHYRQAARLVVDTDADAALAFYLSKADPLLILRDLLGHSTVLTTEKYLRRLDTTRIYRQAYEGAGAEAGLTDDAGAEREAAAEFPSDAHNGDV